MHFRTRVKHEDLSLTIRQTLERFEAQTGIATAYSESGTAAPLPADSQLQVLHILQEALSNVRKHSGATRVTVDIRRNGMYEFCVRDDGSGFDAAELTERPQDHIGLRIMRERAQRIGAQVHIDTRPGGGTSVTLTLPVAAHAAGSMAA